MVDDIIVSKIEEEKTMVQPHHHHDGTKSSEEPSYNIFRDSCRKCMKWYTYHICEKNDEIILMTYEYDLHNIIQT